MHLELIHTWILWIFCFIWSQSNHLGHVKGASMCLSQIGKVRAHKDSYHHSHTTLPRLSLCLEIYLQGCYSGITEFQWDTHLIYHWQFDRLNTPTASRADRTSHSIYARLDHLFNYLIKNISHHWLARVCSIKSGPATQAQHNRPYITALQWEEQVTGPNWKANQLCH